MKRKLCEYCTIHYESSKPSHHNGDGRDTCVNLRCRTQFLWHEETENLRSTVSEERLSSLTIVHIHEHKNVDIDNLVSDFSCRKGRCLAFFL